MTAADPRVALIAALAENRVIGRANRLPWHLPADLAHFRRLTLDKPIVMGRRTWESLPGLLPRRRHIVVTRNPDYRVAGCVVVASPRAALDAAGAEEILVIGGAALYHAMLPLAWRLYLTFIALRVEDGDTFFPPWDASAWQETARAEHPRDARNPHAMTFVTLERQAAWPRSSP